MKLKSEDLQKLKQLHLMLKEATFKEAEADGMIAFVRCLAWLESTIVEFAKKEEEAAKKDASKQTGKKKDASKHKSK